MSEAQEPPTPSIGGPNGSLRDWPNAAGFTGLDEERGPIDVPVTGTIPAWAAGSLYRTGPGASTVEGTSKGTHRISHWFDGLGHAHKFDIIPDDTQPSGVRVTYSSRRQSEVLVDYIQKHGASGLLSFGQKRDPCIGLFGKMMVTFKTAFSFDRTKQVKRGLENVAVNFLSNPPEKAMLQNISQPHATEAGHKASKPFWLLTDTSTISKVDPNTLEPLGLAMQEQLHPDLVGPLSCAHAARDPLTGDIYNFNLEFGPSPTYRIFCIRAATGKVDIIAKFSHSSIKATYTHSFFLTEHYVIMCLAGARIGLNGASILFKGNVMDAIEPFDPRHTTKWVFVDRTEAARGVVAIHETDASFFFHSVNAFEEDAPGEHGLDTIYCDMPEYPNFDVLRSLYYDALLNRDGAGDAFWSDPEQRKNALPTLTRYRFRVPSASGSHPVPPNAGKIPYGVVQGTGTRVSEVASPKCGELPTINPAFVTKRHRYVYSIATHMLSTLNDCLVKTDMDTGKAVLWKNPHGHTPGEAIFVARPGGEEEDDGCLLTLVLDGHQKKSYLLCLDAKNMEELGRAECNFPIAFGFHGTHVKGRVEGVSAPPADDVEE